MAANLFELSFLSSVRCFHRQWCLWQFSASAVVVVVVVNISDITFSFSGILSFYHLPSQFSLLRIPFLHRAIEWLWMLWFCVQWKKCSASFQSSSGKKCCSSDEKARKSRENRLWHITPMSTVKVAHFSFKLTHSAKQQPDKNSSSNSSSMYHLCLAKHLLAAASFLSSSFDLRTLTSTWLHQLLLQHQTAATTACSSFSFKHSLKKRLPTNNCQTGQTSRSFD